MSRFLNGSWLRHLWPLSLILPGCQPKAPSASEAEWAELKGWVRKSFPMAQQVSVATLDDWRAETNQVPLLILDRRERVEYETSHLPGAVWTPDEETAKQWIQKAPAEARVVVYCSVGYRSSQLVEELSRDGYTNVFNLEGSAFEWANAGKSLENLSGPVPWVHPFDAKWGRFLQPAKRAKTGTHQ